MVQKSGRVQLYPNLTFNGRCEAALQFYQECFQGSTVFRMRYENAPAKEDLPCHVRACRGHVCRLGCAPGAVSETSGLGSTEESPGSVGSGAYFQGLGRKRDCSDAAAGNHTPSRYFLDELDGNNFRAASHSQWRPPSACAGRGVHMQFAETLQPVNEFAIH